MTSGVSVVIAARNAEDTIGEQLHALCGQPWPGTGEIIVADNGSTDRTSIVAAEFHSAAVPVRVIDAGQMAGAGHARNQGVSAAAYPKIAFCDADDVVGDSWIVAVAAGLDSATAVGGSLDFDRLNPAWSVGSRGRLLASEELPVFDGVFPVLSSCNLGIRRSTFEQLGGFDVGFLRGQDAELSLRLHKAGHTTLFLPDAVVHYRMRSTLRDIYAQARGWGQVQVALRSILADGVHSRPAVRRPRATARSWMWLGARVPLLLSRSGRARWAYVAGTRVGALTEVRRQRRQTEGLVAS